MARHPRRRRPTPNATDSGSRPVDIEQITLRRLGKPIMVDYGVRSLRRTKHVSSPGRAGDRGRCIGT